MSEGEQDRTLLKVAQTLARLVAAEAESSRAMTGERASDEVMPSGESAAEDPLTAYRQSLLHDLSRRYQVDTRFVRLRLLDMMRSEHALQFREQAKDFTDLGEVLAAIPERAMVLLGAPGCGKSTLLRRLQLDDARDRLADHGEQVSLFVSLGAYPLDKDPARDAPRPLDWLKAQWRRQAPNLPDIEALLGQRRVLLLLDALNEMPHRDADDFRQRVEKWRCFLRDDFPPGNRAVFSCRSLDYSETLSVKDDLDVRQVRVQPLAPTQIEEFLRLHAVAHADSAWTEIRDNERLLELYSTPYFVKLLTDQLAYDPRVANERSALFTGFVRRALEREIAGRNSLFVQDGVLEASDREQIARRDWEHAYDLPASGALLPQLAALAYAMQEQFGESDGKQVMMPRKQVLALFQYPRPEDLLKAGEQLAVLDEEHRAVRFFHQLLQEYFAARQLATRPAEAARLARSEWRADRIKPSLADKLATLQDFEPLPLPDPTGWEETAVLAASMAADSDAFVRGLVEANLALAARCAAALNATDLARPDTIRDLQRRLLARMTDREADLRARIEAGLRLGELGDPRFERHRGPHGDYLLPPLITVTAGDYTIGDDQGGYRGEKPARAVAVAAFEIGQFPVTNAEFALFLRAGGYADDRWWETPAAKAWRHGEGVVEGQRDYHRDWRKTLQGMSEEDLHAMVREGRATNKQLQDFLTIRNWSDEDFEAWLQKRFKEGAVYDKPPLWEDTTFNNPSQPVVGVCWHEARAYCAWLSAQTGSSFRLPSEAEREAAARGQVARKYPYPGDFDAAVCNTFESHIRRTTPVGLFTEGSTAEGVADLAGNVWDWTSSAYLDYPYEVTRDREDPLVEADRRVLRGGSWYLYRDLARSASRYGLHPYVRDDDVGFRVVRASALLDSSAL